MAFPVQFAKLSSSIHRPAVQPYYQAHSSPAIQDSHYDLNHSALHRKSWLEYREDEKAVSSVNDPVCARRVRVKPIGAAADSLPADEKDGELPLPTISPTSSRDDLSILGERRLTSLARHRSFWLSLYFVLNLTLTLYNKAILVSFPFPYTLTAIHSLYAAVGGRILLKYDVYRPRPLSALDYIVLAAFSVLYSINIAVSNASLELVSIPLHQVIRGTTPLFTTALAFYLLDARITLTKLAPLLPVVFGVGLATYGDYSATAWGFSLTLLGAVLAAFKTVTTHLLQTPPYSTPPASFSMPASRRRAPFLLYIRLLSITLALPHPPAIRLPHLRLHPLDLLTRMSPFAFAQCLVYAHLSGELSSLHHSTSAGTVMHARLLLPMVLAVNGAVAFGLNVVSFEANRRAGAVAMGVASNVKQVLTILCAVSLFEISVSRTNATGILLTLVGGTWYAAVEGSEKRRSAAGAR